MAATWLDRPRNAESAAARLRALIARKSACAAPGAYDGMSALLATPGRFRGALSVGRRAVGIDGAARSRPAHARRRRAQGARDRARLRPAADRRLRHRFWRGAQRHAYGARDGGGRAPPASRSRTSSCRRNAAISTTSGWCRPTRCAARWRRRRRRRPDILICARTDAAGSSLDDALVRARRYHEAGADIIFVEALTTRQDIVRARMEVKAPLLANMTEFGRTPDLSLQGMGRSRIRAGDLSGVRVPGRRRRGAALLCEPAPARPRQGHACRR